MVKKKKEKKEKGLLKGKILTKPKAKLPSYDPTKMLMKGTGNKLVSEGRTKYFDEEYREETKWLS